MLRKPVAVVLAASALVATLSASVSPAEAQWRRGYYGGGAFVGGALLGLGVGSLLAAPYYARPPIVYAPPPPAYYPPAYAYAPPYYAPYYRPY